MSIDIKTVESKKDLKQFVKLPFKLYKGNPMWIPLLIMDELDVFNPDKNPAFENADAKLFMAYQNGDPVGRVVGILSHVANEKYQTTKKSLKVGNPPAGTSISSVFTLKLVQYSLMRGFSIGWGTGVSAKRPIIRLVPTARGLANMRSTICFDRLNRISFSTLVK